MNKVNKYDVLALIAQLSSDILMDIAGALVIAKDMLETQATVVDEKQNFHEYAARTIETLQEGE